jgi:hypothetical protein
MITKLEQAGNMYISDGDPAVVAKPPAATAALGAAKK